MIILIWTLALSTAFGNTENCENTEAHRKKIPNPPKCGSGESDAPRDKFPRKIQEACKFDVKNSPLKEHYDSYHHSIREKAWEHPDQVASWIGQRFAYNPLRAKNFSNDKEEKNRHPYSPDHLFLFPGKSINGEEKGSLAPNEGAVCLDLAHFARETLMKVPGVSEAKYLRLEYAPCKIVRKDTKPGSKSPIFRRHWLTSYKFNGKYYFMADTRFNKGIYGPFDSVDSFINDCYNKPEISSRSLLCYQARDDYRFMKVEKNFQQNPSPLDTDLGSGRK